MASASLLVWSLLVWSSSATRCAYSMCLLDGQGDSDYSSLDSPVDEHDYMDEPEEEPPVAKQKHVTLPKPPPGGLWPQTVLCHHPRVEGGVVPEAPPEADGNHGAPTCGSASGHSASGGGVGPEVPPPHPHPHGGVGPEVPPPQLEHGGVEGLSPPMSSPDSVGTSTYEDYGPFHHACVECPRDGSKCDQDLPRKGPSAAMQLKLLQRRERRAALRAAAAEQAPSSAAGPGSSGDKAECGGSLECASTASDGEDAKKRKRD